MQLQEERIESLKAGVLGSSAIALTYAAITLLEDRMDASFRSDFNQLPFLMDWSDWFSLGSAALMGLLFGVTYRYIVRQDPNLHLASGAVLAFGLVRGLSQIEPLISLSPDPAWLVLMVGESLVLFAVARLVIDIAFLQGWVKRFP
ncbi:hypothetical protein ACQ4M4_00890 [Leptolyngbya sp. AN02str]|uniref:hypothetical protein n=1 Tax=Leptolyngbya sp. AN02str TaxID=3423363 RepID=UPI003D31312D